MPLPGTRNRLTFSGIQGKVSTRVKTEQSETAVLESALELPVG